MVGFINNLVRQTLDIARPNTYLFDPQTNMLQNLRTGTTIPLSQYRRIRPLTVADPGHGVVGVAPGAAQPGVTEAALMSTMAREFAQAMERQGHDVIITRGPGPLRAGNGFDFRNKLARMSDYFISLHANGAVNEDGTVNRNASGTEIFANSSFEANEGRDLRDYLVQRLNASGVAPTKARQEDHNVTRPASIGTDRYAVLVETGYLCNDQDRRKLQDPVWRQRFVTELAGSIGTFHKTQIGRGTPNESRPRPRDPNASWVILDRNGIVIDEQNGTTVQDPNSTTKMAVLYTIGEMIHAGRLSQDFLRQHSNDIDRMALLSDNDAATRLAQAAAGSVERFANTMNSLVRSRGMYRTHYVNANGMPDPNQYSTAYDMAHLAYIFNHDFPELAYRMARDEVPGIGRNTGEALIGEAARFGKTGTAVGNHGSTGTATFIGGRNDGSFAIAGAQDVAARNEFAFYAASRISSYERAYGHGRSLMTAMLMPHEPISSRITTQQAEHPIILAPGPMPKQPQPAARMPVVDVPENTAPVRTPPRTPTRFEQMAAQV